MGRQSKSVAVFKYVKYVSQNPRYVMPSLMISRTFVALIRQNIEAGELKFVLYLLPAIC